MIHPDNKRHACIWAAIYVKELVSRGYGADKAAKETMEQPILL